MQMQMQMQMSEEELLQAISELKKALEEIKEFGYKNSGKGYSCAKKAEEALNKLDSRS